MATTGRNQPCPCGSGRKYKQCCLAKDEEQARQQRALLAMQHALPYPATPVELAPPDVLAADERRKRFEAVGSLAEQVQVFREALAEGLLGSEEALDMLEEIRAEAAELEDQDTLPSLLEELRAQAPKLYEDYFDHYDAWLIADALERQEYEALPALLEPFAREPDRHTDPLFEVILLLMYHAQDRLLLDLLRQTWPGLKRAKTGAPADREDYRQMLIALTLFDYLDSTPAPRADDPVLLAALNGIGAVDQSVRNNLLSLLGQRPDPLCLADFLYPVRGEALRANLARLTVEWLGDLHRRHSVSPARGELARKALMVYLLKRAEEGVSGRRLLVPATEPLGRHLDIYLRGTEAEPEAPYAVASLLELLPRYVDWLVERGFAAPVEAGRVLRGLSAVADSLLHLIEVGEFDRPALRALERASLAADEAAVSSVDEDPLLSSPLFEALREAGEEPDPAILDEIKALGPAAVRPLIATALDEWLHFADQDAPEVWAPLHAVRLLGELEAAEAVEALLPLFEFDDDWLAEALPEAYGRIGQPALEPLRRLLFDHEWHVHARGRTTQALAELAQHHPELRSQVVDALVALLDPGETQTDDDRTLNGFAVGDLLRIKAVQAGPAILRAFDEGLVDESIVDRAFALRELGLAPLPPPPPAPALGKARPSPGMSRNAPCPCGSGKKYKKCCGR